MKITQHHFYNVLPDITDYVADRIVKYGMEHRIATPRERDRAILDMIQAVYHDDIPKAGPHRHPIWESGWAENLNAFDPSCAGIELAKPKYHSKYQIARWKGNLVVPLSRGYEYNMLAVIGDWVFDRYLRDKQFVAEFGCGTGHNLFRVRDVNPEAMLYGLDWAESACRFINLQSGAGAYGDPSRTRAERFDYFNPRDFCDIPSTGSAFVTVASLEQLGSDGWVKWVEWAIAKKPDICIHIEPIEEVLDDSVLLDNLSLGYFKKRNYLSGFLSALKKDYKDMVRVVEVVRTGVGSKFIEGYTVVVWSPV